MRDLEKLVDLGREFAKPWKQATKVLSVLLVVAIGVLLMLAIFKQDNIVLQADFNNESEITQSQG